MFSECVSPKLMVFLSYIWILFVCLIDPCSLAIPGAGLGFVTSLAFIFFVGMFASSWVGGTFFWLGEWFIKRMPFVKHLYSASKQISAAISPGNVICFWFCNAVILQYLIEL